MLKTVAKLFDVHQNTITNWKKENKKGLTLILKYFTKEELQEFLMYGSIEKYEFMQFHNYLYAKYQFISILIALVNAAKSLGKYEELYIDYFAYSLSRDISPDLFDNKEKFFKYIMQPYDDYKAIDPKFNSIDLSESIEKINLLFPKEEKYVDTIVYFMYKDFIPFIKSCVINQPEHINLAIKFCIKYNLYKYKSSFSYQELYQKFEVPLKKGIDSEEALIIVEEKFMYEEFRIQISKINQAYWHNKAQLSPDEIKIIEKIGKR